jgi:hypothetical protein
MAEQNVYSAWNSVMQQVQQVGKTGYNQSQGFSFRGVDAVVNAVGPALREHGVIVIPDEIVENTATEYTTGKYDTRMVNRLVRIRWKVVGPEGDLFTGESVGEAADAGDKAMSKAQSVAYRVFLLQALCIPTGDPDPDAESHERTSRATDHGAQRLGFSPADKARDAMLAALHPYGWTVDKLIRRYRDDYDQDVRNVTDAKVIREFTKLLVDEAKAQELDEKAQQELADTTQEPLL